MNRFFFILSVIFSSQLAFAQVRLDSLTPFDTIGIVQKRTFFSPDYYTYHAATNLSGLQLIPLMLELPDSTVQTLARRARRRYVLIGPLYVGSLAMAVGGARAFHVNNIPLGLGLALGTFTAYIDGTVKGFSAPPAMRRAAQRYNQLVRYGGDQYANPLAQLQTANFDLTIADTINVPTSGSRYTYRGIRVVPDLQMKQAMLSVNDPYITEGLRQNRVVRGVSGVVAGLSASYLTLYGLNVLFRAAAGKRTPDTSPLVYVSTGGLLTGFIIGGIANRTSRRIVGRYNERLRTR